VLEAAAIPQPQADLWLLEELGVEYSVVRYERDPVTNLAPASLEAVHPLGKSPVIRDQGSVIAHPYVNGDFYGVRDVAANFAYVEYESDEKKLYDLDADPYELENKAGDAGHAATESRLAARLDQLLH